MGFNLGAFAGGAAQGGLNSYVTLKGIEQSEERLRMQREEADYLRQQREKEAALDRIYASTMGAGNVKTDVSYKQDGQEYTGVDAPAMAPTVTETPYSRQDKMRDFQERAAAAGVGALKVQGALKGEYETRKLQRDTEFDDKFDKMKEDWDKKTAEHAAEVATVFAKDGAQGVIKKFGPEFTSATGQTIGLMGDTVIVKGKDGKTVEKFGVSELQDKMDGVLAQRYAGGFVDQLVKSSMFKNSSDAMNFWKARKEVDVAERNVAAKEALVPSEIAKNMGAANYYNNRGAGGGGGASGGLYSVAKQMVSDGEAKDVPSAIQLLKKGALRDSVEEQWNKERVTLQGQGISGADMAQKKVEFMADKGFAPVAAEQTIKNGFGPDGKTPVTQADIDAFNRKFPNSAIDPSEIKNYKATGAADKVETKSKAEEAVPTKKSRTMGEANPYVDKFGRPLPNAREMGGARAPIEKVPAALGRASAAVNDLRTKRIQDKLDAGLPLDPVEQLRAQQAGLLD